ncbi:streptophobe family protein [Actinomadura sp. DC4]|uniref:streptophobe family protein n=1 Tax=Actinomadura sp. DC4 TaxID=3055069 RepID=UPI0025AF1149|nr:streptophobe family protein [Actinomadura sp. DC4]MDN3359577.1 streptophobe family protein [Actinomadura sp. DC4]
MREAGRAAGAVALAYVVMGLVAAAGLWLIGAGPPGRLTLAAVALAGGGAVELQGALHPAAGMGASVHGALRVMPLGVSLSGAVVLALLLRRRAPDVRSLVTTAVAVPLAFALPALAAHGRLTLASPCAHRAYGLGGCQSGRAALGGIALDYHADVWRTALGGLVWALVVIALASIEHVRLPGGLRPAVTASVTVLLWAALATVIAGLALAAGSGTKSGAALLLGPNAAFAGASTGIGVPWAAGPATRDTGWTLAGIAHDHGLAWLVPVAFAAVVLLAAGALTAAHTPPGAPWPARAGRSALAVGTLVAAMTAVAGGSAHLSVSVLGFTLPVIVLRAAGDILVALVLGAAAGAVAGLAGGALTEAGRGRVRARWNTEKARR